MYSFTNVVSLSRGLHSVARQNATRLVRCGQRRSMSTSEEEKGGFNFLAWIGGAAGVIYLGSLGWSAISLRKSIIETGHDRKAALRHD
ncbi:hypothetical protein LSH36_38g04045 [Paralvinella palmiformis]|uniref:Uncharacterized protein n=1 Tax=Paralvinella palmiformis TaxID=53620 RepID=A0AAD9NGQ6_9ANNE|nr:hypothetical protein LSH36_38g04045 [Paralvinella palmiformis]